MKFILERFKESSSHAGLAAMFQAAKFFFPQYAAVMDAATALFAALAVAVPQTDNTKAK